MTNRQAAILSAILEASLHDQDPSHVEAISQAISPLPCGTTVPGVLRACLLSLPLRRQNAILSAVCKALSIPWEEGKRPKEEKEERVPAPPPKNRKKDALERMAESFPKDMEF